MNAPPFDEDYTGRHRLVEDRDWLRSVGIVADQIVCPNPDAHRGLFIARESTWREPAAVVRAMLDSYNCPWCGGARDDD